MEFDNEYQTKLDFAKLSHAKVAALMVLEVLLLDEVSMLDTDCFTGICNVLSIIDHSRRPEARAADCFGPVHVILLATLSSSRPAQAKHPSSSCLRSSKLLTSGAFERTDVWCSRLAASRN